MFKKLFSYFSKNDNDEIKRKEEIEVFKDQITITTDPEESIKFKKQLKLRIENALSRYDFIKKEKIIFPINFSFIYLHISKLLSIFASQ